MRAEAIRIIDKMKYFVIVFALFAATFAQDAIKCPIKTLDSFYSLMDTYGSLYNGSQSNQYYSFVGEIEYVMLYLKDNPSGSVSYSNATLVIRSGVTGKIALVGSFINFLQNNKFYRFEVINGQKSNCTSFDSGPVPQFSKVLSSLYQIYPFPGSQPKPGEYSICQGSTVSSSKPPNSIFNVVWDGSEMYGGMKTFSVLYEIENLQTGFTKFRPLTDADKHFFTNPCPKGGEVKETNQLIELIHGALRFH